VNTIDDLRGSLERHTAMAPDGLGMVELARTGAIRLRRRRRITTTVAAVIAVLVAAVAVPLATRPTAPPAVEKTTWPAAEMTVSLATGSGFTVTSRSSDGTRQYLTVQLAGGPFPSEIQVYSPGTFQRAGLPPGKSVQVGGHAATLVPTLDPGLSGTPPKTEAALVWPDPSGAWVTVSQADTPEHLLRLAAAVRIGEPAPLLGPLGLAWLPAGYGPALIGVASSELTGFSEDVYLTATDPGTGVAPNPSAAPSGGTTKVHITVSPAAAIGWHVGSKLPPSTFTVAGHPAWWQPDAKNGAAGSLLIDAGSCGIRAATDDSRVVTRAELEQMMTQATYRGCTGTDDWVPIAS
jgi:hypothetical protein